MTHRRTIASVFCTSALSLVAMGAEKSELVSEGARVQLPPHAASAQPSSSSEAPAGEASVETVELESGASVRFGQVNSKWWSLGAGVANDLSDSTDLNVSGAFSYFLAEDVEFVGELGGWYYGNEADAWAVNPSMVFRWHFFNNQKWTIYGDLGIGLLFSTDDVPEDGTTVNFTPRAGAGVTRRLGDSNTRWQAGVRWAHISNARFTGDSENPSRDSVMFYTGLVFPY